MFEYILETGKFLIYNAKKSNSFLYSHIPFPKKNNPLIMMGRIRPNTQENRDILELIFESFKNYYQIPFPQDPANNLELYFENALQKTNQELQLELIRQNKKEWLEKCSLFISVIKEKTIHFTYLGNKIEVFLIRNNKISNILNNQINDKINPLKIFTHITSGELKNNDYLLICNSTLLDYFSQEKLKKVILAYPPEKACQYLKSLIATELEPRISIAAAILKISSVKKKVIVIEELESPPEETQSPLVITPQASPFLKKWRATILENINLVLNKIKIIILKPVFFFKNRFSIKKIKEKIAVARTKFKFLSSYNKIILLTCAFLLLLFVQSIAFLGGKQLAEKQRVEENEIKQEIQNKQEEAEVLLNYKNKEKAEKILLEIELLIQKLPSKKEKQKDLINELEQKNQDLLNKTRDIFIVKPHVTANLLSLPSGISQGENPPLQQIISQDLKEKFSPQKLLFSEQYIYAIDLENNAFSATNLQNKKTFLNEIKTEKTFNAVAMLNKESLLLSTKEGALFKFVFKEKSLNPYKIESKKEKEVQDMRIYQNKLYILDAKNNQILKYREVADEFRQETDWLKEKIDIKDVISFAIDGDIYLVKKDGQILKLFKGEKQNFDIFNLRNDLLKPVKVFTDIEANFIYLLDPLNKRVVVINKESRKAEKQLKCEELSKAKNLIVFEKEKKIYLLTDKEILEIEI